MSKSNLVVLPTLQFVLHVLKIDDPVKAVTISLPHISQTADAALPLHPSLIPFCKFTKLFCLTMCMCIPVCRCRTAFAPYVMSL